MHSDAAAQNEKPSQNTTLGFCVGCLSQGCFCACLTILPGQKKHISCPPLLDTHSLSHLCMSTMSPRTEGLAVSRCKKLMSSFSEVLTPGLVCPPVALPG